MLHRWLSACAFVCLLAVIGQGTLTTTGVGVLYAPSGGAVTPSLVNFRGMPNAEAAFGSVSTNGCSTSHRYCTWYVDPVLSGNMGIVCYEYSNGSASIPVVTDDQSNTYTHFGTDALNATNNYYVGCWYKLNITNAPHAVYVTWSATVSNPSAATMQYTNVTGVDGYSTNSGNAATTFNAGSITASAANDMYVELVCGTSTVLNVGAWTIGSQAGITWVGDLLDRRDACAVQHGVKTATGALNPQLTGASNNYVALAFALTSGTQGTAPTGMYIKRLYTVNSAATPASPLTYQVPVESGDLIVDVNNGGDATTAVSDGTNGSWKSCGPSIIGAAHSNSNTYYFANSAAGTLAVSMTLTSTHDIGPASFYDVAGAATTQICNRASLQATRTATGANYSVGSSYSPSASSGLSILTMAQDFDTSQNITAPSGAVFDAAYVYGQSLDGPSYPDQNNGLAHVYFSSNSASAVTFTQASSTEMVESNSAEFVSFQASGATVGPVEVGRGAHANDSGTTAKLTSYAPFQASDLFAVIACTTATTGTITISDPTNGTYTSVDGPTNNNGVRCKTAYKSGASGSTVTITATFGTSAGFTDIMLKEFANVTTLDQHGLAANTSAANGTHTSSGFTTTSAQEAIFGAAICNSCTLTGTTPPSGTSTTPWTQDTFDGQGQAAGHYLVSATGTYTVVMLENGAGATAGVIAWMSFH